MNLHSTVRYGFSRFLPGKRRPAGANANHGWRTNADKRRSVEVLLRDDEWAAWSDSEIARRCAVSQPFVGSIRKEIESTYNGYKSPTRIGADGRTQNVSNIGTNQPQRQQPKSEGTWQPAQ